MEAGGGVGEQVPDDDQDGAGDRDQGFELAAAFDEAPVALAEEGVGLGGGGGGLAEHAFEVGVAFAGLAASVLGPDWMVRGHSLAQDTRCAGGGELGHVQPDLGDDDLRGVLADAGDLVEAFDDRHASGSPGHGRRRGRGRCDGAVRRRGSRRSAPRCGR